MKIKKKTLFTFSEDKLSFYLPTKWTALSEKQLRYILKMGEVYQNVELKTLCLIRFLKIRVIEKTDGGWLCSVRTSVFKRTRFFLQTFEVDSFIGQLSFLDEIGSSPFNLSKIGKYKSIDVYFHEIPFIDYIRIENFYQGYLYTRDNELVKNMARLMYVDQQGRHPRKMKLSNIELSSVIMWYASLKNHFSGKFSYFFQRVQIDSDEVPDEYPDMETIMNAEIRALTGGDIVKERAVLEMDVWRALTELNEKAREAKTKE